MKQPLGLTLAASSQSGWLEIGAGDNYSAHVPDLPGCVATGATIAEVEQLIREAIEVAA